MLIGANTLYPYGLMSNPALFNLVAVKGALHKLADVGYEAIEYSHAFYLTVAEATEAAEYARALGLVAHSVHTEGAAGFRLGHTPEEKQGALLHCLEVGAALGVRVLVVHTPCGTVHLNLPEGVPQAQVMEADLAILEPVCLRARDLGIRLALENGWGLAHMEYVLRLCDALPAGSAGICVDTGHANLGDLGPSRALRLAGKRLITTHLHDNLGKIDDHLPPGEGRIDWVDVFSTLREIGYPGPLLLELTDGAKHRPYDQDLEMRQGVENTRKMASGQQ